MKFLKINEENQVIFIHHVPFDEKDGLGKTEEELKQEGVLIEDNEMPDPLPEVFGKRAYLFANPLRYEYIDRPLTQKEKLQQMVDNGIISQEQMDDLLV